jgi:hypothetical protein
MQELLNRLSEKAGISADQATKSIETIKEYVKEKFPMLGGAVDNMFSTHTETSGTTAEVPNTGEHSIMDKISDVIPGQAGEKAEEFAKNAAHKAEEVFDGLKDKLSGMFGGGKK